MQNDSQQVDPNKKAGEFFAVLLQSATNAHALHLQTRSFAMHSTLDIFYKSMPELVDEVIEAYQGCYGIVMDYPFERGIKFPTEPLAFIIALREYVDKNRMNIGNRSNHQNLVDNIASLIDSTCYKLKFLH